MDLVTLDFETYYAPDYKLKKLTVEEYIRDDQFEPLMVGIKVNDESTYVVDEPDIRPALVDLRLENRGALAHNAVFDMAILNWYYDIRPGKLFDTASMARPFHSKTIGVSLAALVKHYRLGEKGKEIGNMLGKHQRDFAPHEWVRARNYCATDVDLTYELFKILAGKVPATELEVIDTTLRMFTEPTLMIDERVMEAHLAQVIADKNALIMSVAGTLDPAEVKKKLGGNDAFADMLLRTGIILPKKYSEKQDKMVHAFAKTDQAFMDLEEHPDPKVQALWAARIGVKSTQEEKRSKRFVDIAVRGTLPVMLKWYGAHTGRFSGGDKVNLQNLPRAGNMRKAVTARPGHVLVAGDLSQIEARLLAWLAGEEWLLNVFRNGQDPYCEFASGVFGRTITKADNMERRVGKTCILGLGYMMGVNTFQGQLLRNGIEYDEIQTGNVHQYYRRTNPNIVGLWKDCDRAIPMMIEGYQGNIAGRIQYERGKVKLPNGLYLQYPYLRRGPDGFCFTSNMGATRKVRQQTKDGRDVDWDTFTNLYGGKLTENIIQALARIIITDQMLLIKQHFKIVFQVHDEIVVEVPIDTAPAAVKLMEELMTYCPPWANGCPITNEVAMGANYGDAK